MAKKIITLKNPASPINLPGGRVIGNHNITEEIYDELIRIAPAHADLFIVKDAKDKDAKAEEVAK